MNCSVSLKVLPKVEGREELFRIVDKVIDYIKSTGVKHVIGPSETTMDGDFNELMEIIKNAQLICQNEGANGVFSLVTISYNTKGVIEIDEKIKKYR